MGKFYVLFVGRVPGIYEDWGEAEKQVFRFSNARHKSYRSYEDAHAAYARHISSSSTEGSSSSKKHNMGERDEIIRLRTELQASVLARERAERGRYQAQNMNKHITEIETLLGNFRFEKNDKA
ncbi:hypothetical protein ACJIZ3_021489 [Penstemon smallii]|uniref:Ribonuclease H1 N-terminal domain-containing protein n=1 Tax=Penstemon smallii TaxID=265156 RepID=A0ABD3SLJ0_9LAMI